MTAPEVKEDPVTEDMVAGWAEEFLTECFRKYYTDHLSDDRQRRVRLVSGSDDEYNVWEVHDTGHIHPDRRFRIAVIVEEVSNG